MQLVLRGKRLGDRAEYCPGWFPGDLDFLVGCRNWTDSGIHSERALWERHRWLRQKLAPERNNLRIRKTPGPVGREIVGRPKGLQAGGLQRAIVRNSLLNRLLKRQYRRARFLRSQCQRECSQHDGPERCSTRAQVFHAVGRDPSQFAQVFGAELSTGDFSRCAKPGSTSSVLRDPDRP